MQGRNVADVDLAFGHPGVMGGLHAQPDAGAVAEQFAQKRGDGRVMGRAPLMIS
jgi:hypothetical protein